MTNDDKFQISRRKVLAGLGTVGLASAGAGMGTTAYFSDQETFEDNVLTAGSLDLLVDYYSYVDQGDHGIFMRSGTADGDPAVKAELDDIKPGDGGLLGFCFRVEDNPAYLWLCGDLTANDDNGSTEPEVNHSDDTTFGPGEGDLADAIDVVVSYCDVPAEPTGPEDFDRIAKVWSGSFADFMAEIQTGLALDGAATGGVATPGEQACFAGTSDPEADNPCLCIDWDIPTDVGNEIQTDSLMFDLQFYAEQCRHNDGTDNPCVDVETVSGDGWGKLNIEGFDGSAMQAKVRSPNSGHEVFAGASFNAASTISSSDAPVPDTGFVPFELDYDGAGTLTWTYNGVTNTYSKADLGVPQDKIEITVRGDTAGTRTSVRNAVITTQSVVESFDDVSADDTSGKQFSGLVGVPDMADGFTVTGEVELDYDPAVTSEVVAMYVHVDTTA
ncbi:MAG: SipW-dependent-type signal peptide-containing protein [Haloferacaceae archaeon]